MTIGEIRDMPETGSFQVTKGTAMTFEFGDKVEAKRGGTNEYAPAKFVFATPGVDMWVLFDADVPSRVQMVHRDHVRKNFWVQDPVGEGWARFICLSGNIGHANLLTRTATCLEDIKKEAARLLETTHDSNVRCYELVAVCRK